MRPAGTGISAPQWADPKSEWHADARNDFAVSRLVSDYGSRFCYLDEWGEEPAPDDARRITEAYGREFDRIFTQRRERMIREIAGQLADHPDRRLAEWAARQHIPRLAEAGRNALDRIKA
ncbi:hypothetical protein [Bifidobacterium sp. SO1]|uniref:hypothetical protein n=1 Tax=Bifidobacterium sp. SO1 TaxID=2809029 RepID=UPI001BDC7F04|nr:hypothetical protein [Bifidobacterium sp. SO1]MBT1162742.1 hypothetical protein [Bifidobacterium sp. SO1]